MIDAGPARPGRRWVAWDDGAGDGGRAHLALCDRRGACRWARSWPGGYGPTITALPAWSSEAEQLVLLTVQYGAAAEDGWVFGLRSHGPPRLLDHVEAGQLQLRADVRQIVAFSAGAGDPPDCYGWSNEHEKLVPQACTR